MNRWQQLFALTLATLLVIIGGLALAQTEWADSFRPEPVALTENGEAIMSDSSLSDLEAEEPERSGVFVYVGSFLKEALLMGVPGLITLGILSQTRKLAKRGYKRRKEQLAKQIG